MEHNATLFHGVNYVHTNAKLHVNLKRLHDSPIALPLKRMRFENGSERFQRTTEKKNQPTNQQ